MRTTRTRLGRLIAGVAAFAAVTSVVAVDAATQALPPGTPPAGTATLTPSTGTNATPFNITLPLAGDPAVGAKCPGDGNAGYRWGTYITPRTNDPATLVFDGLGSPTGQPAFTSSLRNPTGEFVRGVLPGLGDGLIAIPPAGFSWTGVTPPPGEYNIGIACTLNTGTVINNERYWNTVITVTANGGGFNYTVGAKPAAPVTTTVVNGDTTATVNFTHAASTPATTGYAVTVTPTAPAGPALPVINLPAGSTSVNLTSLTNGTTYSVTVTATNPLGTSAASNAAIVNPAFPQPPAPVVRGFNGVNSVRVEWDAPTSGPAPTGYNVTVTPTGGGAPVVYLATAAEFSRVFTPLPTGTYNASVVATYAPGTGITGTPGTANGLQSTPATPPTDNRPAFSSLVPSRFADSRNEPTFDGQFRNTGPRAARSVWEIKIAGRGGVPANADAAIVNLTINGATSNGFATLFPCGPRPNASSINYTPGATTANEVVAKLSPAGTVCVYTHTQAHVIVDVAGHATNASYQSLAPRRFADSRNEPTFDGQFRNTGIRGAGTVWQIDIAGRGGIPASTKAAAVNLTINGATRAGFAVAFDCGTRPTASSINYRPGVTRANEVITKLSATGKLCVYTHTSANVIVDVVGIIDTTAVRYVASTPTRFADSRNEPTFDGQFRNTGLRGAATVWEIKIAGRGGVPANAQSAVINLTITGAVRNGFATIFPCGPRPNASSINYAPGVTAANETITKLSATGTVCVYTHTPANVIVDVVGHTT